MNHRRVGAGVPPALEPGASPGGPEVGRPDPLEFEVNSGRRDACHYNIPRGFTTALAILLAATTASLAAEWESRDGFRRLRPEIHGRDQPGFQRLDASAQGIAFTNHVSRDRSILNRNLLNGSGVAAGDVDGDGLCDLYFCGLESANALFRNLSNWRFERALTDAGIDCPGQDSTGAVFADLDQDRDLDLLVTALNHRVRLFKNNGRGQFREATDGSGLAPTLGGTSMALADVDGDGDLDLYVAHYRPDTIADRPATTYRVQVVEGWPVVVQVNGQPVTDPAWTNRFEVSPLGRVLERGLPDHLYLNDGRGRFTPVSFTQGAFLDEDGRTLKEAPHDWGLSVQFHDLNRDGAPDLYVCNDFATSDRVWINDGTGRFRALPRDALQTICASSMGVDGADIDRDGDVDLFVVDMLSPDHRKRHVQLGERLTMGPPAGLTYDRLQVSRNTLLLNRGDTTYAEIGYLAGLEASDWAWQPVFLDVDLDGFEDILVANGVLRDFQNIDATERMEAFRAGKTLSQRQIMDWIGRFPTLETPNLAYRNRGDLTFAETGAAWGFATPGISHGMALADLDNDGDMDVVVNQQNAAPGLYRNDTTAPRVAVRLKGSSPNTAGIGALIAVQGGPVPQSQEILGGGRYLSSDQAQRVFAAGSVSNRLRIEVTWRNGHKSLVDAEPNTLCEIDEHQSLPASPPAPAPAPMPIFAEVTGLPDARHLEQSFDESARQPLLMRLLDRLGPGIAWHDLNRDGWDDLIVGNGRSGLPIVLFNQQGNSFRRITHAPFHRPLARDQTSVLGAKDTLIAGSSNYEDGSPQGGLIRVHDFVRRVAGDSLAGYPFACGPLALADIDGDGDLDLFVGGRAVPGRYPEPADSILFRNDDGRFVPLQRWEKLGLVSGALFTDLDSDGTPELVLAPDWSPLRVFRREEGEYREKTDPWGFRPFLGWWAGVATGDFDGDGRLEIVASNWGHNSSVRASAAHPRRLHYGDLDDNGSIDLIEARFDPALGKEVPDLTFNRARAALPFLRERVPDYATYGRWSVDEIYGDALGLLPALEVNTLASTIFRRRGDRFEATPLPVEAQFAPAFGVTIGDLNGDGTEDLFLSQNFLPVAPSEVRVDPSPGLCLEGDGRGGLAPVPTARSGVRILGDQRGCALGDFDADGRLDLAVGQNSGVARLFRNVGARPALRIRLRGPDGNPEGIGAQLRLAAGAYLGPVREVQAGSGYWSQNSAVQVMNLPENRTPDSLQIRWPGGRLATVRIPLAREIAVGFDNSVKSLP